MTANNDLYSYEYIYIYIYKFIFCFYKIPYEK